MCWINGNARLPRRDNILLIRGTVSTDGSHIVTPTPIIWRG